MATLFILYIAVRCRLQPHLGPTLPPEERKVSWPEKIRLLRAGILPFFIFFIFSSIPSSLSPKVKLPTSPLRIRNPT
jgi:TRAP-type mannitol/chloroaromatic compound transport system permease large subunit